MNQTSISWTDFSSNPIYAINKETGKRGWSCTRVSEGCQHCYAERINMGRFGNGLAYTVPNRDKVEFKLNMAELESRGAAGRNQRRYSLGTC